MFEKEIDEIYELCKRVVNEVPAANVTFDFSGYGLEVRGGINRNIVECKEYTNAYIL